MICACLLQENALKAASLLAALDVTAYGNQHGESRQAESGVSDFQTLFRPGRKKLRKK
jgi:hypothetical protein